MLRPFGRARIAISPVTFSGRWHYDASTFSKPNIIQCEMWSKCTFCQQKPRTPSARLRCFSASNVAARHAGSTLVTCGNHQVQSILRRRQFWPARLVHPACSPPSLCTVDMGRFRPRKPLHRTGPAPPLRNVASGDLRFFEHSRFVVCVCVCSLLLAWLAVIGLLVGAGSLRFSFGAAHQNPHAGAAGVRARK